MKYNKIVKENDYNINSFLITTISCVVLLLVLCYFGINGGVKGTYSASTCPSGYFLVTSAAKCCPTGFTYSNDGKCYNSTIKSEVCIESGYSWVLYGEGYSCRAYAKDAENVSSSTVNFDPNGGTVSLSSKSVQCGSSYGTLPTPTKSGYKFTGWYTSPTGGSRITSSSTFTYCSTQTLYAHWEVNSSGGGTEPTTSTVYFNANGGSVGTSSKQVTCGSSYGTLPTPTKSGSTFDGWYTAASGGTKITSTSTFTFCSTQTLYAHWSSNASKVNFDATGGSVSPSYKNVTCGDNYGSLPTPTRANYTFDGWYTAKTGGTKITSTSTFTFCSTQTLYAQWTEVDTEVRACYYCTDSEEYVWGQIEVYATSKVCTRKDSYKTETACLAMNDDEPSNPNPSNPNPSNPDPGDDDPTPTPTKKTFTATFDKNGGTLNGDATKSCSTTGNSCTVSGLPTATREGYTFKGWGASKTCTSGYTNSVELSSSKTFYACWVKKSSTTNPDPDDDEPTPGIPDENITDNPPTGQTTMIAIIWFVGLMAIAYGFYYFKNVKEN